MHRFSDFDKCSEQTTKNDLGDDEVYNLFEDFFYESQKIICSVLSQAEDISSRLFEIKCMGTIADKEE